MEKLNGESKHIIKEGNNQYTIHINTKYDIKTTTMKIGEDKGWK